MAVLEFSPELIDLGLTIGLMRVEDGHPPADAELNSDFFVQPDHYLTGVFTQPGQREALLRMAGRLMSPDGPPVVGTADEQWVSIASSAPNGSVTSGLFLVTKEIGDDLLVSLGGQVER